MLRVILIAGIFFSNFLIRLIYPLHRIVIRIINERVEIGRGSGRVDPSIATVVLEPFKSMDDFEDRYFKLNRKLMTFCGFWYTQPYRERLFRYYIICFVLLYRIFAQVCQLLTLNFDLRSTVPVMQSLMPGICFAMLHYSNIMHYVTMKKIMIYIKQDWRSIKDDFEVEIMRKHASETKRFTLICGLMFYSYISFSIFPFFLRILLPMNEVVRNTDRFPLFSCYNYLLNRESYYYCIVPSQSIILALSTTVGIACYSSFFWYIQHICARLSIIKNKIHQPFINIDEKKIVPAIPADLSQWMIDVVKHLTRTTELMNLVNKLAEQCYMFQMLLGFFIIIIDFLCLFQIPMLLEYKEGRRDVPVFVIFIFVTIFPIYVYCHLGQKVIDYSTEVYKEACMVPIHEISLKTQKLLLITLIMTARPCAISIGQVFVSSHEFFSDLIRKSLSFSMVLYSTQKY